MPSKYTHLRGAAAAGYFSAAQQPACCCTNRRCTSMNTSKISCARFRRVSLPPRAVTAATAGHLPFPPPSPLNGLALEGGEVGRLLHGLEVGEVVGELEEDRVPVADQEALAAVVHQVQLKVLPDDWRGAAEISLPPSLPTSLFLSFFLSFFLSLFLSLQSVSQSVSQSSVG